MRRMSEGSAARSPENPVSCAAATVVLEELTRPDVMAAATRLGEGLRGALDDL
jgi:4-aminobutyrate aminotransferase-like enzyme